MNSVKIVFELDRQDRVKAKRVKMGK